MAVASGILLFGLLGACGGDDEGNGDEGSAEVNSQRRAEQEAKRGNQRSCEGRDPASNGGPMLTVHMTGLLLLLPPAQTNSPVDVLLPVGPPSIEHFARLGFGIDPTNQHAKTLCKHDTVFSDSTYKSGICYVDLREWQLSALRGDPRPAGVELPAHVLNVTRVAGTRHKILPSTIEATRRVSFAAGWAGPNSCTLANWTYTPVNAQGQSLNRRREPLANVIQWEIRNPTVNLTFTKGAQTVSIPLHPHPAGNFEIILANLPANDLAHLPPGEPPPDITTVTRPSSAVHFHKYYDLLRDPARPTQSIPTTSPRRGIPQTPALVTTRACPVEITRPQLDSLISQPAAIATYACMPASGERGS